MIIQSAWKNPLIRTVGNNKYLGRYVGSIDAVPRILASFILTRLPRIGAIIWRYDDI